MKRVIAMLAVSLLASAAVPVASLRSSSDFQLSGVTVNTAGVSSWPILAGDRVVAGVSAATIRFTDGTMVTLGPRSQAKIDDSGNGLSVRLVSGSMSMFVAASSAMSFYSGGTALKPQPGVTTTVSVPGSGSSGGTTSASTPPPPPKPLSRY